MTTLVVDDDTDFRTLVRIYLKKSPTRIIEASDGCEAVAVLARQHVDVVIMDIVMPGGEGLGTIAQVHRQFPTLPVIAVSGVSAGSLYLRCAKALGAHACLQKPVSEQQLLEALRVLACSQMLTVD